MLRTNYRLCSVTQHQCRHRQMCEQFHKFTQYTHFCLLLKMTFLDWTIYSWQGFNSLGCPLMLRTNYRCVQLLNISVDIAKCVENFRKFTQYTHFLSVAKNDLSWLNNLFMARFQLIRMSSYAKNKIQMCSVTQHQCRHRHICRKLSQIHPVHSLLSVTKNVLSSLNNAFMARFQLVAMSSYAKMLCSGTQHQRLYVEIFQNKLLVVSNINRLIFS